MKLITKLMVVITLLSSSNSMYSFVFFEHLNLWTSKKEEVITHEQTLTPESEISISNTRGDINIKTWNKPKILIEATKVGTTEELKLTKIETLYTKKGAHIKTVPLKAERFCTVNYTLIVPANAILTDISTEKGNITVKNVSTPSRICNQYGNISLLDITNSVQASTKFGHISIQTREIKAGSKIVAMTERGNIKLQVPTKADAQLYAKTNKGTVTSECPVTLEPRTMKLCQSSLSALKRDVRGAIGNGGTSVINLHTTRGNVKVLEA